MAASKKPDRVEIEWLDARTVIEQVDMADIEKKAQLVRRTTLGYLVLKNRERLAVAGTFDPADDLDTEGVADITVIPRAWVQTITRLTPDDTAQPEKEDA